MENKNLSFASKDGSGTNALAALQNLDSEEMDSEEKASDAPGSDAETTEEQKAAEEKYEADQKEAEERAVDALISLLKSTGQEQAELIFAQAATEAESLQAEQDNGSRAMNSANEIRIDLADENVVADSSIPEQLAEINRKLDIVLANNKVVAEKQETCCQKVMRWTNMALGVTSNLITIVGLYGLIVTYKSNSSSLFIESDASGVSPHLQDTPGDISALNKIVQAWQTQSEASWWQLFSDYIKNNSDLTINDQIVFLQFTMQLSPAVPFFWASNQDRLDIANDLVNYYTSEATCISDIYLQIASKTYNGKPLPRAAAANELILALGQILVAKLPIKRPAVTALSNLSVANEGHSPMLATSFVALDDSNDTIQKALSIAGTLSFAVPEAGPVLAADFQLLGFMLGGDSQGQAIDFTPVFQALSNLKVALETYISDSIAMENLRKLLDVLNTNTQWLKQFYTTLGLLENSSDTQAAIDTIINLLPELQQQTSPGEGTLFDLISKLMNDDDFKNSTIPYVDKVHYQVAWQKYQALVTAVTFYLMSIKYNIKCQQYVLIKSAQDFTDEPELAAKLDSSLAFATYDYAVKNYFPLISPNEDNIATSIYYVMLQKSFSVSAYDSSKGPNIRDLVFFGGSVDQAKLNEIETFRPDNWTAVIDLNDKRNGRSGLYLATTQYFNKMYPGTGPHAPPANTIGNGFDFKTSSNGYYTNDWQNVPGETCGGYTLIDTSSEIDDPNGYWFVPGDMVWHWDQHEEGGGEIPSPHGTPHSRPIVNDFSFEYFPRGIYQPSNVIQDTWQAYYKQKLQLSGFAMLIETSSVIFALKIATEQWATSISELDFGIKISTPLPGSFTLDLSTMTAAVPESEWAQPNAHVRYALVYMRGNAPPSDKMWTTWYPANGKENPTLNIPVNPLYNVDAIAIIRQFGMSTVNGQEPSVLKKPEAITILTRSSQKNNEFSGNFTYQDTKAANITNSLLALNNHARVATPMQGMAALLNQHNLYQQPPSESRQNLGGATSTTSLNQGLLNSDQDASLTYRFS